MSKERWTDAKVKNFISKYIKSPALWDTNNSQYALKSSKEDAYRALQDEFGITLTEVRNKIRIYRTTYAQEVRKMETNSSYTPKLSWFSALHQAFHSGKVKSFRKTPKRERDVKRESQEQLDSIQIEYQEVDKDDSDNGDDAKYEIRRVQNDQEIDHHIIIEPFEEDCDEGDPEDNFPAHKNDVTESATPTASTPGSGMQSNELFLKSLQATLDKLPDERNMWARIKIQEVLYKIAHDMDK